MSKYTTEVRYICEVEAGLSGSVGYNSVKEVVTKARPKIFEDDIPFFNEEYRESLECKILQHYYTREICAETVGLWKLWLNNKMREIMPYYNSMYESTLLKFNPLFTKDFTETYEGAGTKDGTDNGNTVAHGSSSDNATSRRLYSDTPQGGLSGVESERYLTNATKNIGSDNATSDNNISSTNNSSLDTTENFIRSITGYDGSSASKLLQEYRKAIINVDMMVINELSDLFFNLW